MDSATILAIERSFDDFLTDSSKELTSGSSWQYLTLVQFPKIIGQDFRCQSSRELLIRSTWILCRSNAANGAYGPHQPEEYFRSETISFRNFYNTIIENLLII